MKTVIIGTSGHYPYSFNAIKNYKLDVPAYAVSDGESSASLAKTFPNAVLYTDWRKMLDEVKPDIAVVNTYFYLNADIAVYALEHGISVFLEKPAAITLESLERLKKAYYGSNVKLGGMFGIRYEAPFQTAKKHIGEVGVPRLATAQKSYRMGTRPEFYRHRETYGGLIPWVAIHAIDWITWLTGEKYKTVTALHSNEYNNGHGDMEVTSLMQFTLTNGLIASVNADMLRPACAPTHGDDRIRIIGTNGVLEVLGGKVCVNDVEVPLEPAADIFADLIEQIVNNAPSDLTAENLFDSTEAALLARESADTGKSIVLFA